MHSLPGLGEPKITRTCIGRGGNRGSPMRGPVIAGSLD